MDVRRFTNEKVYNRLNREFYNLESTIADAYDHTIQLTQAPKLFYEINLEKGICSEKDLDNIMQEDNKWCKNKIVDLYMLKNKICIQILIK